MFRNEGEEEMTQEAQTAPQSWSQPWPPSEAETPPLNRDFVKVWGETNMQKGRLRKGTGSPLCPK